jgi:hypothetical protein
VKIAGRAALAHGIVSSVFILLAVHTGLAWILRIGFCWENAYCISQQHSETRTFSPDALKG